MATTLITNGTIVSATGRTMGDVLIDGETIVGILAPGQADGLGITADRTIDASGLAAAISAVEGGAAGSWMLSNRGPQMIERDWRPGFTIDLQQKDLRLALDGGDELGVPLPGTAFTFQLYRGLQAQGLGSEGNHALIKALEELSGIRLGD